MAGKGKHVEGLLGTRGRSRASLACFGLRSICSETSSDPGGVSACEEIAVVFADPSANPGMSPLRRGTGRLPGGDFGMFSLEARMAHEGKAGAVVPLELSVWEGRGAVMQMAPTSAGWHLPAWQNPRSFAGILPCLSRGASRIPLHILPAMFRLHRGSGSPACRILPRRRLAVPRTPRARGRAALLSVRSGAGRDYRSRHAAACPSSSSSSSSAVPGRARAGMLQAALEQASAGHVPGEPGNRRRQPRCR